MKKDFVASVERNETEVFVSNPSVSLRSTEATDFLYPTEDQNERLQALDTTKSFIVQAPAGSGKTELLTQRYLALLANAKKPEEILAITFTRKAAAEMRARILEALHYAARDKANISADQREPLPAHHQIRQQLAQAVLKQNQQENWNLLENPNRLRIQTIDAFCANLTRQMPILSRFGAQPDIHPEPMLLYREAATAILASLEAEVPWTQALTTLLLHLDNDYRKVATLLCDMLARRDQWLSHIVQSSQHEELRHSLERGLQQAIIETLLKLHASLPADLIGELVEIANFAARQVKQIKPDALLCHCENFIYHQDYLAYLGLSRNEILDSLGGDKNPLSQSSENLFDDILQQEKNKWLGIAELLLTKQGEWRKNLTKNEGFIAASSLNNREEKDFFSSMKMRAQSLLTALAEHEEIRCYLQAVSLLPPPTYSSSQWEILTSLISLLPILVAELQILFQENEAVDYIEVAQAAIMALGDLQNPTDLALKLDANIQHILVDEFQDTSSTQFRLLELLTTGWQVDDGRTLFLVGDPMQSIYRFRKAEVGLFIQAWQRGIGSIPLIPLTLRVNFRSSAALVDWVNRTFMSLMPQQADSGVGAVPYSRCFSKEPIISQYNHVHHAVTIHGLTSENKQEAELVTELIQNHLKQKPEAKIAILVRSRTHLLEILPALTHAKISYRAIEIDALAQRSVIHDLLALTRALLNLADRIAWLAILRAPWCGLTLAELLTITESNPNGLIWDCLTTLSLEPFASPAKENLTRCIAVLKQSIQHRQRTSLASWIYGTWLALGGPTSLRNPNDLEDVSVFFKLIEKVQQGNNITDIQRLTDLLNMLYATPNTSMPTQVEVMTIHKAKGLEFDTVILPGLERLLPADPSQLLLCLEKPSNHGTDLLLAPIKASIDEEDAIYNYLRYEEKIRAEYETVRLLYVATTRAKEALHLIATLPSNREKQPSRNSLLAHLWPSLKDDFLTSCEANLGSSVYKQEDEGNNAENSSAKSIKRPLATWQLPNLTNGMIPEFNSHSAISSWRRKTSWQWDDNAARHIGTIVHFYLCQMSKENLAQWDEKRIAAQQTAFEFQLKKLGIFDQDLNFGQAQIKKALLNVLSDERGRWILDQKHQQAQSEYALLIQEENEAKKIIIDRTFVDETNTRWIIDYKIVEPATESLEQFLTQQVELYRPQLERYAMFVNEFDPEHPIRLGLYFPLIKVWQELEV